MCNGLRRIHICIFYQNINSFSSVSRPILIEVPHFASLRDKEREIVVMRSDDGETWSEHPLVATDDAVAKAMEGVFEGGNSVSSVMSELAFTPLFTFLFCLKSSGK